MCIYAYMYEYIYIEINKCNIGRNIEKANVY